MPVHSRKGNFGTLSLSDSLCPYTNLAFEKKLLENLDFEAKGEQAHIFLYRNQPSIVMGRFQVPWREINLCAADELGLTLVRRRSGGGCVYHDPGNWNFCVLRGTRDLPREKNLSLVLKVLADLGVYALQNERFDLVMDTPSGRKKISGSAFKQQKDRSFHHGTLLVNAQLSDLKGTLGLAPGIVVEGKGIKSHPSPVTNISSEGHSLNYQDWVNQWEEFLETYGDTFVIEECEVREEAEELKSWQWLWGETPHNDIRFEGSDELFLSTYKGVVTEVSPALSEIRGIKMRSLEREYARWPKRFNELGRDQVKILINLLSYPKNSSKIK